MSDPATLSVATVAITTSLGAFYQMMPPISEIRSKSDKDRHFAANVRVSEAMAAFIALSVGGTFSALTGGNVPVYMSALFAAGMIGFYEYTLRTSMMLET